MFANLNSIIEGIRALVIKKRLRLDLNITQAAKYIGIPSATLRRFEKGADIKTGAFLKCANWIDWHLTHVPQSAAPGVEYRDEAETAHVQATKHSLDKDCIQCGTPFRAKALMEKVEWQMKKLVTDRNILRDKYGPDLTPDEAWKGAFGEMSFKEILDLDVAAFREAIGRFYMQYYSEEYSAE